MKMPPLIKNPDAYDDPPRPFFEHIVALRACLINAVLAWAVCCLIAGVFSPKIMAWLQAPADALVAANKIRIVSLNITGGFGQIMSIAMWGGTALGFPFIMYFILRFVFPALTRREKAAILFFLTGGVALFGVGVVFAYGQLAPNVVRFFDLVNNWVGLSVTEIQVENYVPLIMKLILAFGLVFQVPLLLFVLGWLGVITSGQLRAWRRFAIVLAFFFGMVLTPPDPMSQILMAVPLVLLYELSIWGVRFKELCSGDGSGKAAGKSGAAEKK
ncbi:MAG: twin-arginine translocase subunit TatC [Kiritimatiellia bacterium]